jgi:hypothetical protein
MLHYDYTKLHFVPSRLSQSPAETTTKRSCSAAPVAAKTQVLSAVNFVSFSAGAHRLKGKAGKPLVLRLQKGSTVAAALILFVPI